MAYDYSLLDGKIVSVCGTHYNFAQRMGMSERSLSLKMNSKVPWKQPEISKACKVLSLSDSEIPQYFFKKIVQQN